MEKYYLAYGSNLDVIQMKIRCKNAYVVGTTVLNNYRLVYKGSKDEFSYLTIERSEGSYVPLGIYKISFFDEKKLDIYEVFPDFYHKEYLNINIDGKISNALIYVMNYGFDYNLPSNKYIDTCTRGYEYFGFDKKILEEALEYTIINKNKVLKK